MVNEEYRAMTLKENPIIVTQTDLARLKASIDRIGQNERRDQHHLVALEGELARAKPIASEAVPGNLVTMNSKVRLKDLDSQKEFVYTLVYPNDADPANGRVSVLAPVGTALLGNRVGSDIEWAVPAGMRRLRVEEILFQPEAAGQFNR
jgi:regulator of nucleoside diphosphate kinase